MIKVQYIYCPSCSGIVKRDRSEGFSSVTRIPTDVPTCTVCGRRYEITIDEKLVITIRDLERY